MYHSSRSRMHLKASISKEEEILKNTREIQYSTSFGNISSVWHMSLEGWNSIANAIQHSVGQISVTSASTMKNLQGRLCSLGERSDELCRKHFRSIIEKKRMTKERQFPILLNLGRIAGILENKGEISNKSRFLRRVKIKNISVFSLVSFHSIAYQIKFFRRFFWIGKQQFSFNSSLFVLISAEMYALLSVD